MTRETILRELSKLSNSELVRLLAIDGLSEILLAETSSRLGVESANATRVATARHPEPVRMRG